MLHTFCIQWNCRGRRNVDNIQRERPAFNTCRHVFINRLIPLNFLKRLHPVKMKKVSSSADVIKTPYTRQGDLTDSFVNRGGGAPASFARLIKINGEQVQGRTRGEPCLASRRPKGCSHDERAGAKKNYKNNLAEEGAVNWGGKLA